MRVAWLLILLAVVACQQDEGYKIVQLTEYTRHGARTTYKDSLHYRMTLEKGTGILVPNGQRMHELLGQQLRKDYPSIFTGLKPNPEEIELLSSTSPRTILSAHAQLLGLYPLGLGEDVTVASDSKYLRPAFKEVTVAGEGAKALPFGYKPFPLKMINKEVDFMFFADWKNACPNAVMIEERNTNDLEAKAFPVVQSLSDDMIKAGFDPKKIFNTTEFTIDGLGLLYDEAVSYKNYHNGELYPGLTPELYERIERAALLEFIYAFPTDKFKRLIADSIANSIIQGMDSWTDPNSKSPKYKFRLFSGHDTGILSNLLLLKLTSPECAKEWITTGKQPDNCEGLAPFAANYLYELLSKDGKYYVRTMYNSRPIKICPSSTGPNFYCEYSEFRTSFLDQLAYKDSDKLAYCGSKYNYTGTYDGDDDEPSSVHTKGIVIIILIVCILVLSGFLLRVLSQLSKFNKNHQKYHMHKDEISNIQEKTMSTHHDNEDIPA